MAGGASNLYRKRKGVKALSIGHLQNVPRRPFRMPNLERGAVEDQMQKAILEGITHIANQFSCTRAQGQDTKSFMKSNSTKLRTAHLSPRNGICPAEVTVETCNPSHTSTFNLERLAVVVVAEDVVIRNRIWPLLRQMLIVVRIHEQPQEELRSIRDYKGTT